MPRRYKDYLVISGPISIRQKANYKPEIEVMERKDWFSVHYNVRRDFRVLASFDTQNDARNYMGAYRIL